MLLTLLFFCFVHISLLVPGYVAVKKTELLSKHPGIELSFAYLITIVFFGLLATLDYAFGLSPLLSRAVCWTVLLGTAGVFIYKKYYQDLWKLRFPLICLVMMSLFSSAFVGLTFNSHYSFIPDPTPRTGSNYQVPNVKVLNIAQTQANDNYVPYRQAQFFMNRSDPGKDGFISEWGVTFFQRTPLMGAVTANYFNLFDEKLPVNHPWSNTEPDASYTYLQFQVIAHVLNALFVIPAFFLLTRLFAKKTAVITCLFLVISQFFLYNAVFSWPKSLVAFFILLSWLLILENRLRYTVLAGIAGGVAYLAHDLAVLYIGTSVVLLLWNRRFKDTVVLGVTSLLFAIPWLLTSALLYHKPSSFILYPISTKGIPQPEQKALLIHEFLHTSPLRLAAIRVENFIYLLSPYQLLTSEGGQAGFRRLWAFGLFSIPGSVGIGLILAAIVGAFRRLAPATFWILAITPVILETVIIGYPKGLGSLHFAEAIVVLLSGLGVACLVKLKHRFWLLVAYLANCVQLVFFVTYSFKFSTSVWLAHPSDILRLLCMLAITVTCGWLIHKTNLNRKTWMIS